MADNGIFAARLVDVPAAKFVERQFKDPGKATSLLLLFADAYR
jgi:hypothetical protein